jgi:Flp pilus assembly protein CpaB
MKLRRGWIWYLAGLLLAIIAGAIALVALRQAVPQAEPVAPPTQPVIVARVPIEARQVVLPEQLETKNLLLSDVPSGAVFRMEDAAGKFTLQPISVGQPLLAQSLVSISPGSGSTLTTTSNLAALLPVDKIGVVLPASDLLSKSGEVNIGDRIDILASLAVVSSGEGKGGQVTLFTLQNVSVVKILQDAATGNNKDQPGKIQGLVVAVNPQDAATLKYFVDAGANVSIALRPTTLTSIFDVVPVTINYIVDQFRIKPPQIIP